MSVPCPKNRKLGHAIEVVSGTRIWTLSLYFSRPTLLYACGRHRPAGPGKKTFCPRYSGTGYYPCFPFAIVFFGEDLFEPLSLARVEFGGRLRPTSSDCFGSDILSLGLGC